MPRVRVHNFAISVDDYGAGPDQSLEHPLGVGGPRLHEWVFATRSGRRMLGEEGGDEGLDEAFIAFVSSPAVAHVRLARETAG